MNTTRYKNLDKIKEAFVKISSFIELSNENGETDFNKAMEDFFIPILNLVTNTILENANKHVSNYPVIDLHDLERRKAIQLTSQDTSVKKRDTFNKFFDHKLDEKYDTLYIVFLKMNANLREPELDYNDRLKIGFFLKDLNRICRDIRGLSDENIQHIADYIEKNLVETLNETVSFKTPEKIEVTQHDIKNFIYESGHFIGSEDKVDDVNRTVSTYNSLFNKVNKLSLGARRLLVYVISNHILGINEINYQIQSYYIFTAALFNKYRDYYSSYVAELIGSGIASKNHDIMKEYFGSYDEGLGVFYRGELEDGNALAFLYDYLGYDYKKLEKVLVDLDFSALR